MLLQLVEQQVPTDHAVHLDRQRSVGVCLSLGSQVHLQESHSCEQAKERGAPIPQQEQAGTTAVCKDFNLPPEPLCSDFSHMKHTPRNTCANHVGCTSPAAGSVQM